MYNSQLVVCVKVNGKVLREVGDTVYIPFGSHYELYLKNLGSTRVQTSINIDGKPATEGCHLVIEPGKDLTVERFIKGGNLNAGNKFKFIERSASVDAHRGIGAEDGLIRVAFEYEQLQPAVIPQPITSPYWIQPILKPQPLVIPPYSPPPVWYSTSVTASADPNVGSVLRGLKTDMIGGSLGQAGITVPGEVSSQRFQTTTQLKLDGVKHSMVLRLLGEVAGKQVKQAVTVKHKSKCVTCGRQNKATSKFCSNCGTGLELVG